MVGLEKLLIPLKENELSIENIKEYLPSIMQVFDENKRKIREDYETYKGAHDIFNKQRPFEDCSDINNQIVNQHLWAMVNFKCGYGYGNPLEFAKKDASDSTEMNYFNKYVSSVDFRGIVDNLAEWVYAVGVAFSFTQPKKSENLEYDAPFECFHLESDTCAKVYSSYLGQKPLFDLIMTPISKKADKNITDYHILSIYTPNKYYEFKYMGAYGNFQTELIKAEDRYGYNLLPLTEFYAYHDRVGIVESCKTAQNALDMIDSNGLDNIQEVVNQMLVIKNALLGTTPEEKRETLTNARKNGVLEIMDNSKELPADVKTLTTQLSHSDVNTIKNQIKADMFGNWGVPLASSNISSGNVTQGGGEISNGWENAYSVILKENNNMLTGFRNLLKQFLWICTNMPNSKVITLNAGDIEIKYNIARSNNLLTKTQSYGNLVDRDVPPDIALELCELTGDPSSIGKMIEEYKAKKEAQAQAEAERVAKLQNQNGINSDNAE